MPHILLKLTDEEKDWMDEYAQESGVDLSEAVKNAFFEKLEKMENEYYLKIIEKHEKQKAKGLAKYYSHEEVKKELGIFD